MKFTRRELAAALAVPTAGAASPQASPEGEDLLAAAREQIRSSSERYAKIQVPVGVEPAFAFRA